MEVNQGLSRPLRKAVEDVTGTPDPADPGIAPDWTNPGHVSLAIALIVQLRMVRVGNDCGPLSYAEHIWALPVAKDARVFAGTALTVTDWNPENFGIFAGQLHVTAWRTPAVAAPWVSAACLVQELILTGYSPREAERLAEDIGSFALVPPASLDMFARACKAKADGLRHDRIVAKRTPTDREDRFHDAAQTWYADRAARRNTDLAQAVTS